MTGQEAILAFQQAHDGGLIASWAYSPNGGDGNATGESAVITQERFSELVSSVVTSDPEHGSDFSGWEFDGKTLVYNYTPERSVHQHYEFSVEPPTGYDGRAVACLGSQYGFMWGPSCTEIDEYTLPTDKKTDLLRHLIGWYGVHHCGKIGLESIDDPTDDGCNWVVVDEAKFLRLVEVCEVADTDWESEDSTCEAIDEFLQDEFLEEKGHTAASVLPFLEAYFS